jgi:hypothetical protein
MTKDKECELLTFDFEHRFQPPTPSDERTDVSLLPVSSTAEGLASYKVYLMFIIKDT